MLSPYLGEKRSEPEGGMESQQRKKLCKFQAETIGWERPEVGKGSHREKARVSPEQRASEEKCATGLPFPSNRRGRCSEVCLRPGTPAHQWKGDAFVFS